MKYFNKIIKRCPINGQINRLKTQKGLYSIVFFIIGIASLIWFLIRVIPKPSRASYPCQRAAFPIASSFIIWISVNIMSFIGIKRLASLLLKKRSIITIILLIFLSSFYIIWTTIYPVGYGYASNQVSNELFIPTDSSNQPIGIGQGIFPGRVVWAFDTTFTKWNYKGDWWDSAYTDQAVVSDMISHALEQLSGQENDSLAWDAIFRYFNSSHGKGNTGYKPGEKIAIKLNMVQASDPSEDGGNSNFTPPQTVLELLRQLVYNAGVDANDITFYDIMRAIPTSITKRCRKEFPSVHFVGASKGTYQEKYVRDTTAIHWSEKLDMEINGGNTAYLPTIITQASYIINLANLKGHRYAGVTTCSKNHFGSMSADGNVNTPHAVGLHCYIAVHDFKIPGSAEWSFMGREMGTYNSLVDLMGHKDLGGKTLLFMVDGLFSVPREGDANSIAIKWQQTPFNNHYSSSIFMSLDNVAIESVAIDFLRTEQAINPDIKQLFEDGTGTHNVIFGNIDNYLHEAALADNPPSGTKYAPNWDGERLKSLGVHEHWNNGTDKQYSRNLGKNEGIELVKVSPTLGAPYNLHVETNADNTSKLTWANSVTEGKILVYRSFNSTTNYKVIAQLNGNETTFSDNEALAGLPIYYRVKRVNGSAYSIFSNEVKYENTTGIPSFVEYIFSLYPNPANDFVNIKFQYPSAGIAYIDIFDLSGKQVEHIQFAYNGNYYSKSLNIGNLTKGIYTLNVSIGNIKLNKMLIVK